MKNKSLKKIGRTVLGIAALIAILFVAGSAEALPYAYVTNSQDDNISVIDTATDNVITSIPVGRIPWGVAINPTGTRVYITIMGEDNVTVIDGTTNTAIGNIPVGSTPWAVAINPTGTRVYVGNYGSNSVSVIDTSTDTVVDNIPVGTNPQGLAVNPAGTRLYVANSHSDDVSVIDLSTNTVIGTIPVFTQPEGIVVNPTGTRVYVANTLTPHVVSVIDITADIDTVIDNIGVTGLPTGVAINPAGTRVYVASWNSNVVSVIDTATSTVIDTVHVGDLPEGLAVNPAGTRVYVTNFNSSNVTVISTVSNTVIDSVNVGARPVAFGQFIGPGGVIEPRIGSISGTKFDDINGNGKFDNGEPTLADWTIVLTKPNGLQEKQNTDANGNYNFTDELAGAYIVGEELQNGYIQTAPAVSKTGTATYTVDLNQGENIIGKDFGNFKLGKVYGEKFQDLNSNGIKDPNEVGLPGWEINLNGIDIITGETVSATTTTDVNGDYNFTGLTAGNYIISEKQNGWIQTVPSNGNYKVTLTSGSIITGQDFGNFHKGNITGGGWIIVKADKSTFGITGKYLDNSDVAQGNIEYQSHSNLNIKSTQINTVATTLDKKKGTITGFATVNGKGSYPFIVYIEDNAEPGKDADKFSIDLPTYPYSSGIVILRGGNIQIHE